MKNIKLLRLRYSKAFLSGEAYEEMERDGLLSLIYDNLVENGIHDRDAQYFLSDWHGFHDLGHFFNLVHNRIKDHQERIRKLQQKLESNNEGIKEHEEVIQLHGDKPHPHPHPGLYETMGEWNTFWIKKRTNENDYFSWQIQQLRTRVESLKRLLEALRKSISQDRFYGETVLF